MNKLYAIYKQTSDLDDLPDYVLCLCDNCAAAVSSRTAVALDTTAELASCNYCS